MDLPSTSQPQQYARRFSSYQKKMLRRAVSTIAKKHQFLQAQKQASAVAFNAKRSYSELYNDNEDAEHAVGGEPNFLAQVELYFNQAAAQIQQGFTPGLLNLISEVDCTYEFVIPHVRVGKVRMIFFYI